MHAVTQSLGYDSQLVEERREYAVASVVYKIELVAAFSGDVKHSYLSAVRSMQRVSHTRPQGSFQKEWPFEFPAVRFLGGKEERQVP